MGRDQNFSIGQFDRNTFNKMISENVTQLNQRRELSEEEQQIADENYNRVLENTLNSIERLVKTKTRLLKREIKEIIKEQSRRNHKHCNTNITSLVESLESEYSRFIQENINTMIIENLNIVNRLDD